MKQEMHNCEMVQDLIPLYSEGLCSEESRRIVDEHTKACESCRRLLTDIPQDAAPKTDTDEQKPFLKIRRRMKRSRLGNVLLSLLLAAVVIPVGTLTAGEILKVGVIPSFSSVAQSIAIRQMMNKLCNGDIDGYMECVTYAEVLELTGVKIDASDMEALRAQDTEHIRQTFEAAYGNTEAKRIDVKSAHLGTYNTSGLVITDVTVEFESGQILDMKFHKGLDGLFAGEVTRGCISEEELAFERAMNFTVQHRLEPYGFFENLLKTGDEYLSLNTIRSKMDGIEERFADEYDAQVNKSMTAFYQKDYLVDDCLLDLRYDEEKQMLYYEATLFASDAQGNAILKTRLYSTYEGLIPPTEDMITVYENGCTDALAEDLAKIFG